MHYTTIDYQIIVKEMRVNTRSLDVCNDFTKGGTTGLYCYD